MSDGGASIFIAEDQEYVDKIFPFIDNACRRPLAVVVIDASAMFAYDHPKLVSYREIGRSCRRRSRLAGSADRRKFCRKILHSSSTRPAPPDIPRAH